MTEFEGSEGRLGVGRQGGTPHSFYPEEFRVRSTSKPKCEALGGGRAAEMLTQKCGG